MGTESVLLGFTLLFGVYMAWNVGANDVANAMGTSVGSRALTLRRAVVVAAIMEFCGAFFVGSHVSDTVRRGIVNPEIFVSNPLFLAYGMIAALLAAGAWLQVASYYGWPVSTTHSIIGAILGFGVVIGGFRAVYWHQVGTIVMSWIVSPLMGGIIAYLIFTLLRRRIFYASNPVEAAKKLTPWLVFSLFFVLTLVMLFKGLKNLNLHLPFARALEFATAIGLIAALVSWPLVRRIRAGVAPQRELEIQPPKVAKALIKAVKNLRQAQTDSSGETHYQLTRLLSEVEMLAKTAQRGMEVEAGGDHLKAVERIFAYLQIMSACFVAFAHGANDVANAIGPLAAAVDVLKTGFVAMEASVPIWMLALGGLGIVVGLATWGWRVIETIGKKITELTPTRGFSAEFGAAMTIVIASKIGLPISTTHTLVGAVLGIGLARGLGALNLRIVRDIIVSWIVTIPAGAILAVLFFYVFRGLFG
ncbi:MAG: inorganic phosphate transporter [candidate division KSB1 bacterium]|nr:inorganic phosphate transporter [candidate division KSB1 bacterium]MDZ7301715.1 inorganic phosphate transporter [candidate division KSB1 bacterium]MDZ7312398.1 inorganic phosphate transporter [candidate division KSB1 bacterium]